MAEAKAVISHRPGAVDFAQDGDFIADLTFQDTDGLYGRG